MRDNIKSIILKEFLNVVSIIENDFTSNYKKKSNNFLLNQMDEQIMATMVFVSSFESKSGIAIEACVKEIARLKFGDKNVPAIVNPRNISHDINVTKVNKQIVITDVDIKSNILQAEITSFCDGNKKEIKSDHVSIRQQLLPLADKYRTNKICTKEVDLAFFDGDNWNIMELKAGGNLDSSNAPANVQKLLTIYVAMGIENCYAYFATLYNKNGEGKNWTGAVKKYLSYPSMFLIGSHLWERILPGDITFNEFVNIYREALEEIDLNKMINDIIKKEVGQ